MLCPLMCKLMSEHEHGDGAVRSGEAAAVNPAEKARIVDESLAPEACVAEVARIPSPSRPTIPFNIWPTLRRRGPFSRKKSNPFRSSRTGNTGR
jgi:transposase-like protein